MKHRRPRVRDPRCEWSDRTPALVESSSEGVDQRNESGVTKAGLAALRARALHCAVVQEDDKMLSDVRASTRLAIRRLITILEDADFAPVLAPPEVGACAPDRGDRVRPALR